MNVATQPLDHSIAARGRIVLADDDPAFRESTTRLLTAAGFQCRSAECGATAQQLLTEAECDLLVADIHMPGNQNLELVALTAGESAGPSVLLVTGQPCVATAARAVQARVAGYLIKPVAVDVMLGLIRREVHACQIRRLIQKRRERVEGVLAQLHELEVAAQSTRLGSGERELQAYLAMFTEHVASSLRDLMEFVEAAAVQKTSEESWRKLAEARPFQLTTVLRETVQVLEQTKTAFKSRELADLRKRLQTLLAMPAV
jgi:DNA-binding response OmpR family regulator